MRIKQVTQETGLTEKTIRFYIKEQLITPEVSLGDHYHSYQFSTEDVQRLKYISALRSIGIGISDIRDILTHPELLPDYLSEYQNQIERNLQNEKQISQALDRLQLSEIGDLQQLTKALEPIRKARSEQNLQKNKELKYTIILTLIVLLILVSVLLHLPYFVGRLLLYKLTLLFLGVLSGVMAIRYLTVPKRAKKLPHHGDALVLAVDKDTGFDASYGIGKSVSPGSGFFEQGQGGSWVWLFMLWNELRPDHWYPILQYMDENGQLTGATFPYGGLQRSWTVGDKIPVAWTEKKKGLAYPLQAKWLQRKALVFGLIALLLLCLGLLHLPKVLGAMTSDNARWMYNTHDVLYGIPEAYVGTVNETADGIYLEFSEFSGEKEFALQLLSGEQLKIELEDLSSMKQNSYTVLVRRQATTDQDVTYRIPVPVASTSHDPSHTIHTYNISETSTYIIFIKGRGTMGNIAVTHYVSQ